MFLWQTGNATKGEDIEENSDEWYSRRSEGGLFTFQIVDYILGWTCMEDAYSLCFLRFALTSGLVDPCTRPVHARTARPSVE